MAQESQQTTTGDSQIRDYNTLIELIESEHSENKLIPELVFVGDNIPPVPVVHDSMNGVVPIMESVREMFTKTKPMTVNNVPATIFVPDTWYHDPDTGTIELTYSLTAELSDGTEWYYERIEMQIREEDYEEMGFIHSMMDDPTDRIRYCVNNGIDMDDSIPEFPRL